MKIPNFPPKKIVVPFDFRPTSRHAWDLARELAGPLGASVEAVHVYEAPPQTWAPLDTGLARKLLDDVRRELGPQVQATIFEGRPAEGIIEFARDRRCDLIVMGTHGHEGAGRVLFGSVAEAIARRSPIPVVTVRGPARPVKRILAPVSLARYSLEGLSAAAQLAGGLGASLDLFHADGGKPVKEILAASNDYDLVVLVAHRKSALHDLVLGTTVERVLRSSAVPVLAVPETAERSDEAFALSCGGSRPTPAPSSRRAPGGAWPFFP